MSRPGCVKKHFKWIGTTALGIAVLLAVGLWQVRRSSPRGLAQDIRAGLAARHISDPDARLRRYLEGRYGDLDDPGVRRRVFVDFFDPERIRALQWLVQRAPEEQRQGSIAAMARWVAGYRASLSAEERASLAAEFGTPEGRARLGRATAQYNAQDVHYRGVTAGVISELLHTLNEVDESP